MLGCATRIVLRGQKPLALCDRCPCFGSLYPPLAALTYLRFWLGICRTSLAVSALRIMRYCLYHEKDDLESILCAMLGYADDLHHDHRMKIPFWQQAF